jgi:hypothetical protein
MKFILKLLLVAGLMFLQISSRTRKIHRNSEDNINNNEKDNKQNIEHK